MELEVRAQTLLRGLTPDDTGAESRAGGQEGQPVPIPAGPPPPGPALRGLRDLRRNAGTPVGSAGTGLRSRDLLTPKECEPEE